MPSYQPQKQNNKLGFQPLGRLQGAVLKMWNFHMIEFIDSFIPTQLSAWTLMILISASVFTCFLSTAAGIGGGVSLMAVMSIFFPPTVLIPVHGFIQIGSVLSRVAIMWRNVAWPVFISFGIGGALGAFTGAQVLVEIQEGVLEIAIGMFILWSCFGPLPVLKKESTFKLGVSGALTSALSLFIGVTGPIVAAIIKGMSFDRVRHIATFSACMLSQQLLKIVVFGLLGFSFYPYLPFIALMILFGFFGTYFGRHVLYKIDERSFKFIINLILTILAVRLIVTGLVGM